MICPKRKHSKSRSRKHRANWKLQGMNLAQCPSCRELKAPHVACRKCGYYNGRMVIEIREKRARRR